MLFSDTSRRSPPTGSKALPLNPPNCRLCLPTLRLFALGPCCDARQSLGSSAFPGAARERELRMVAMSEKSLFSLSFDVESACYRKIVFVACLSLSLCFLIATAKESHAEGQFLAGAFAKNINPTQLPVWVNGGIAGRQIDRINDPLHARCLVLGDGKKQVAICIVDNCILPLELVDRAKELTNSATGIALSHILIAATHTHSAVSVAGTHGTPPQQDYAEALPGWIAEGIAEAQKRMVPAQWGTTSVVCEKYIYCRDWLMKPGTANSSPFSGRASDSVSMNPGHDNPNKMAPIGPVDTLVPILSIQDMQGKPISVLASFCTHYAGAPNISADYFGVVCERLSKALRPDAADSFVV